VILPYAGVNGVRPGDVDAPGGTPEVPAGGHDQDGQRAASAS